jgi:hypothetical protein
MKTLRAQISPDEFRQGLKCPDENLSETDLPKLKALQD